LANWAIIIFGQFFENFRSNPIFIGYYYVLIVTKTGGATFWAIKKTHLVTLTETDLLDNLPSLLLTAMPRSHWASISGD
jgi:hypothetical protein